jgi:hypothetical protein
VKELPLEDLRSVMYITAFIDQLPEAVLRNVDLFVAIGDEPQKSLAQYCELVGEPTPDLAPPADHEEHHALAWWRQRGLPGWLKRLPPPSEHQRHRHGYLQGEMDPEHRFYFRGPKGELNLAAQNLRIFMQLGEGVDDETWRFHLREGDYERWFREMIKDEDLANLAAELRRQKDISPQESRRQIFDFIRKKYEKEA